MTLRRQMTLVIKTCMTLIIIKLMTLKTNDRDDNDTDTLALKSNDTDINDDTNDTKN